MDWVLAVGAAVAAAAVNNVLHTAPRRRRTAVVNSGMAVAGAAALVWLVLTGRPGVGLLAGLAWTAVAVALVALVALAAAVWPAVGRAVADDRIAAMPPSAFARHVWLRIPLLTALAEEALFRGVVWSLLDRAGGTVAALLGSAVAFAVSHVVVGLEQARQRDTGAGGWVAATLAATFGAGLVLGGLRAVTGGIWAPAGVHAAVNAGLALVARRQRSRPPAASPPPGD